MFCNIHMNLPGLYRVTCLRRASDSGHYTYILEADLDLIYLYQGQYFCYYGVQGDRGIFKTIFHI